MAKKVNPVETPEAEPVAAVTHAGDVSITIARTDRFLYNDLCEQLGIPPRRRDILALTIDQLGVTVMSSRGKNDYFPWARDQGV